ncbi:MAG: putative sugar nucleotidyl transferase [Candidatus Nezhaarchaeota archaeon]|nr:putative sugar nucleotidyl transferase [Candidatus Nezhaarchaeota archaeon]MCX8141511.1 putative sugar nucleotidyl transferase [Candidatus Nezhaarchaeota archaeon]MDW8049778.1 putative sugar nucleotidyl transferase [Nitrososphaerota archaeon]
MEIATLCVFEDECYMNFLPLTYTKAVYELVCGSKTLLQRAVEILKPQKVVLIARDYLKDKIAERTGFTVNEGDVEGDTLIINGRLMLDSETLGVLERLKRGEAIINEESLLVAKLGEGVARGVITNRIFEPRLFRALADVTKAELKSIKYLWDIIKLTPIMLNEISSLGAPYSGSEIKVIGDPKMLRVLGDLQVDGPVIADVRRGPICVEGKCKIEGFTWIEGPTYIGRDCIIRGAYIRSGCYIGRTCRIGVGSELEETIIEGFTNKQHLGLIARSYIGEWVNIGAGTNNSDLKNTYGSVRVTIGDSKIDTGMLKLGCFISDHVKTSIGTQIYTGKTIGPFSHVHGFIFEDVPPFTIWAKSFGVEPVELTLESAIETQKRMYERRGIRQTEADVKLVKMLFELTTKERIKRGVKKAPFTLA